MRKALITGISGQDGHYLSQFLFGKNYEVHGIVRRSSHNSMNFHRSKDGLNLHYGDLQDGEALLDTILQVKPDEVYNLAAQSHVGVSFKNPLYTIETTGVGAFKALSATYKAECILDKRIRYYQASSSEMYGAVREIPQTELTPFNPRSPYACSKVFSHFMTVNYREAYGMHASCGILFNHESEERGEDFVTRKITKAIANILSGQKCLSLGNLDAKRDWGHARDYVEAMWLMLQQEKPDDYVIATGETHTVREFVEKAFAYIGIVLEWEGSGDKEVGKVLAINESLSLSGIKVGDILVRVDPKFYRPTEVDLLIGDPSKAKAKLGWTPKVMFEELVRLMVDADQKGKRCLKVNGG